MLKLDTKIIQITGVGQTIAKRLEKLGLKTLEDLLYYFPFRYDDFSKKTNINELMKRKGHLLSYSQGMSGTGMWGSPGTSSQL